MTCLWHKWLRKGESETTFHQCVCDIIFKPSWSKWTGRKYMCGWNERKRGRAEAPYYYYSSVNNMFQLGCLCACEKKWLWLSWRDSDLLCLLYIWGMPWERRYIKPLLEVGCHCCHHHSSNVIIQPNIMTIQRLLPSLYSLLAFMPGMYYYMYVSVKCVPKLLSNNMAWRGA